MIHIDFRKYMFAVLAVFIVNDSIWAQHGKVYDDLNMKSDILKSERKFSIYLPPDYESSSRSYPVLYLLHGSGDDQTGWVQFGEVLHIADQAINNGKATPMIIVMPNANTGQRGYFNDIQGEWRYEDFFFDEFIPYVEETYRIKSEKRYRAISGLSMGGGGTFMYALHHPELFIAACPMSANCGPLRLEDMDRRLQRFGVEVEEETKKAYYKQHSAVALVDEMPAEKIGEVSWYIDCGDDDFLFEGNSLVHISMRKKEIPHEFRIRDGDHNWTYWRASLHEVLSFVSDHFHQY